MVEDCTDSIKIDESILSGACVADIHLAPLK